MAKAHELGSRLGADLVLATDPDSDRIGVALRNAKGEYVLLNGNQTLSLIMAYQLTRWSELGRLDGKEFVVKTIVTSQMPNVMAAHFGVKCYDCLTGFKYIARIIRNNEGKATYIGGGEESFGYLAGDFVRDKDAVSACSLVAEARCVDEGYDGIDALRVVAEALRGVRFLPRRARVGRPQGHGGRCRDSADDGRLPRPIPPGRLQVRPW